MLQPDTTSNVSTNRGGGDHKEQKARGTLNIQVSVESPSIVDIDQSERRMRPAKILVAKKLNYDQFKTLNSNEKAKETFQPFATNLHRKPTITKAKLQSYSLKNLEV